MPELPESVSATTADGVRLGLTRWTPVGPRRGVVLCTHAMMADSRYFAREFAPHLAGRGIDVFALDWRGHGASVPPSPRTDRWCFEDYVQFDLPAALACVGREAGASSGEITYLGHSLGGLVGLAAFGTGAVSPPGRLSLWATSIWLPGPGGSRLRRALMRFYSLSARPFGFAPVRWLRAGSNDEPRDYVDQLASWAARGRWLGREGQDYLAAVAAIAVPVMAVCADGDRLCTAADAEALTGRLATAPTLRRVGQAHGDPVAPDHFSLFTDARLRGLWDELAEFCAGG